MNYTVESGINIPMPAGQSKYPFDKMAVGQSFLCDTPVVRSAAQAYGATNNMKFKTRTVDGGIRVWRVA